MPLAKHSFASSMEGGDLSCRSRCLPRKRRHLHPLLNPTKRPSSHHQQQHQHSEGLHYLPFTSTSQHTYSARVSPKILIPVPYPSTSVSALRPCHICHRRPTTRHVLDAYADCDLCGERACYICLRQCDSFNCGGSAGLDEDMDVSRPHGHDDYDRGAIARCRNICSSCAIESVTETGVEIVRCLECVRSHSGPPWPGVSVDWALDGMRHESMSG